MSNHKKHQMSSFSDLKGIADANEPVGEAKNHSTPVKENVNKKGSLALTLSRNVQLKRFPIIAKVTFLRDRPDLVSLLKGMQNNPVDMPPRLKAYLKRETLWDESGITDKGQQVIDSGLFEAKERGLYHIWYTDNDPLLRTRPVLMQRDTAFFDPNMKGWKKGTDAARSEFQVKQPVQLNVLEESFVDRNKTEPKHYSLQLASLEPEVICSPEKSAEIELEWTLDFSQSLVSLKGQLDMLQFKQNKTGSRPEALALSIDDFGDRLNDVMAAIAGEFDGDWLIEDRRLQASLESIQRYPSAVQKLQIGSLNCSGLSTVIGRFKSVQAKHIPIQPADQLDAEKWQRFWLEDFYSRKYHSSPEARKNQAQWLDHIALNDFELPLKEQQSLLSEISRESQPQAYWHVAAMADLTSSRSRKLRMPISLVNTDLLDLGELLQQLTGGEYIEHFIYSDRYVHTSRQSRNLNSVAAYFTDADGLLLTLDKQHGKEAELPDSWSREILQKQNDNHGRYWILVGTEHTWCWECSSGLDFIRESGGRFIVDGSPTFTPKEEAELPRYLQDQINNTVAEAL
ncbi:hypothetical protein HYO33_15055 [Vibrio parahaemolyticus]|uniref:hypothetical protein n=1 Tax=Vibrio parahaemolyticus TaxID=670 RepID=UPI0004DECFC7|nr:hypothetical protein [Vibrio parahaemolyticus]EJG0765547.1 hypothetical protein [Vibrio parahaemolyticus O5:K30]EGR1174453.1 hypothetical protein [Vibrio parahaemolyticus]EHK6024973.1 hypothetical protein [Vibrio parahaemolyticus]EIK4809901.1 hypothetical protein [Vibrio parahaemolyticus]EJA3094841.1 hypothetical protein [Vibrio parahaemolyticus]